MFCSLPTLHVKLPTAIKQGRQATASCIWPGRGATNTGQVVNTRQTVWER